MQETSRPVREQTLLALVSEPPRTAVRDSVWGSIPLFEKELLIIDTAPFQRLRRIEQLGFTSLTFPGAHHTRFEHSLGVYHLTRLVLLSLLRQPDCPPLTVADANTVLAAALLHDIGHYPYSHAAEELEHRLIRRHEEIGYEIVTGPVLAPILERAWGVEPARVGLLLINAPAADGVDALLGDILSGSIDTDKVDYLIRDARHCNVPYGLVDADRLIQSLRVWADPATGRHRIVLDEKGVAPMHSLIMAKYLMFSNVYWHHTVRIATVMFVSALQDALDEGFLTVSELQESDDSRLLWRLYEHAPAGSTTVRLVERLMARRLYKRALSFSSADPCYEALLALKRDPSRRRALEIEVCRRLDSPDRPLCGDEILFDIPAERRFDLPVEVLVDEQSTGFGNPVPWVEVSSLEAADLTRYQDRIRQIRVVAADASLAEMIRCRRDLIATVALQTTTGRS